MIVSNCCDAKPFTELSSSGHGHCSKCGEGSEFHDDDDDNVDDFYYMLNDEGPEI
jgi:hypothetical protein